MSTLVAVNKTIFATKVNDSDRAKVLAAHFPTAHVRFENFVNHIAEKMCGQYKDDHWNFFELSNGGFYMAPHTHKTYTVDLPFGRCYSGAVSSDAFGIICCMYAFCFLAEDDDRLTFHHGWLTDFYRTHTEFAKIWWAVE